jgi:hypothetical protein
MPPLPFGTPDMQLKGAGTVMEDAVETSLPHESITGGVFGRVVVEGDD